MLVVRPRARLGKRRRISTSSTASTSPKFTTRSANPRRTLLANPSNAPRSAAAASRPRPSRRASRRPRKQLLRMARRRPVRHRPPQRRHARPTVRAGRFPLRLRPRSNFWLRVDPIRRSHRRRFPIFSCASPSGTRAKRASRCDIADGKLRQARSSSTTAFVCCTPRPAMSAAYGKISKSASRAISSTSAAAASCC